MPPLQETERETMNSKQRFLAALDGRLQKQVPVRRFDIAVEQHRRPIGCEGPREIHRDQRLAGPALPARDGDLHP